MRQGIAKPGRSTTNDSTVQPESIRGSESSGAPHSADCSLEDCEPRSTRIDRWWSRMLATPARRQLWSWGGPIAVTLLAAYVRLVHLGSPHALVFDETFYVKDAYTLLGNGYESTWPQDADARFASGETDIFSTDPSFVVHPPLGKWLIALGIALFGPHDAVGWRISTAVAGIIAVIVIMLVTRKLTESPLLTVIAGFLFAIDGNAIVMSRVSLLDNFLMLFALAGFGAILLDRSPYGLRLNAAIMRRRTRGDPMSWGPVIVWRPWVVTAGILFGLATAVKWSGVFFLVVFGICLVAHDVWIRRKNAVPFWISSGILTQGPVTFLLFIPGAAVAYLASWTGWILTTGGMYREWAETAGNAWTGVLSWIPAWFQSLWHYHAAAFGYHVGLTTAHPYQSSPWTWLVMFRPTNMYLTASNEGENGCTAHSCIEQITGLGNPVIWWAAAASVIYLLYRLVRYRQWQVVLVVAGLAAGYVPWLFVTERTIFQFYSIAFEPYLILALTMTLGVILGSPTDPTWKRTRGIALTATFLAFAALLSLYFWPLWSAEQIPFWYWQSHIWLSTWR